MINLSMAEPDNILRPRISVVGVGGAGGNAINNMIRSLLEGCDFIAANTDSQALAQSLAPRKLQLGINLSRGLGAGSKPDIGRAAAEEQLNDLMALLEGSDMLFVTAGMGGGTGTGAAPVIARAARESGILTVGVVTKPFQFEGNHRMQQAEAGIAELQQYVDTLIVIPNQNLFRIANERTTFAEAFRMADEVLHSGVRGITDLMVMPGFMNLDFADVKTVMGEMGKAMMGTGEAEGENRAIRAAEAAISNPLLDDISMKGAKGVLINVTGGLDMTLFEMDQAANRIREEVDPNAQIKVGSTISENLEGRIRVSVIATGIEASASEQSRQRTTQGAAAPVVRQIPEQTRRNAGTQARAAAATQNQQAGTQFFGQQQAGQNFAQQGFNAAQQATATNQGQVQSQGQFQVQPQGQSQAQAQSQNMAQNAGQNPNFYQTSNQLQSGAEAQSGQQNTADSGYFTMPAAATPQMMAQMPQNQQKQNTQAFSDPAAAEFAQKPEAYNPAAGFAPRTEAATTGQKAQTAAPQSGFSRNAQSQMGTGQGGDVRITQLSAQTNQAQPHTPIAQRSQSLFQRITGFGLVRPSSQEAEDAEAERRQAAAKAPNMGATGGQTGQQQPQSSQQRLGVDPTDRPALSGEEPTDLLDIPAFLRRQSNN